MSYGSIYKILFPNGKHYIGQTKRLLKHRQKEHRRRAKKGDTTYLYNALRKYDMEDTLELVEIDTADNQEELDEKEIGYILSYNSFDREYGYNGTIGGAGTNGYVYTETDKLKMSNAYYKYHKEHPEAKNERGKKIAKHYIDNPEARNQMSERGKKYYIDNPQAREDAKERTKKYFENPQTRKEHGEKLKKYHKEHPEHKKKILDAKGKNKPFDISKIDGTFVKTFDYQFEAREYLQEEHNITSTIQIGEVLNGNRKSCAGFVFKYQE
jgi:hypothetical protein